MMPRPLTCLAFSWLAGLAFATTATACSLLAPSDAELMAGNGQDSSVSSDSARDTGQPESGTGADSAADADASTCCEGDAKPMDAPADAALVSAIRIRCGALPPATPYTDSSGQVWSDDTDFNVGQVTSSLDMIAGTTDPSLYHTERYADRTQYPSGFTYTFGGLPNGAYVLRLLFAETSSAQIHAAGEREFNVLINGAEVLTNFDIFAKVGADHALVESFATTVQGAPLTVQFTPGAIQNPKVNAIEILAASAAGD